MEPAMWSCFHSSGSYPAKIKFAVTLPTVIIALFVGLLALVGVGNHADAGVIRYALVIGNNTGPDVSKKPLKHAERDAGRLYETLLERSAFAASPRSVLLQAPTRADVLEAFEKLQMQMVEDKTNFPSEQLLFALFFTGHGENGCILLADDWFEGEEIARHFTEMPVNLRIAIFDACNSEGLREDGLLSKRITPLKGLDFSSFPEEVLNSTGTIWYFSSKATEDSYEDPKLGGVLTHFLIEALERPSSGPDGTTLDEIWRDTARRTREYTYKAGVEQTPCSHNRTKSTGEVYFAWGEVRSTKLVLGADVDGTLALVYAEGRVIPITGKSKGVELELRVYPGSAELVELTKGEVHRIRTLEFKPEGEIHVGAVSEDRLPMGYGVTLVPKGMEEVRTVASVDVTAHISFGITYGMQLEDDVSLLPRHVIGANVRTDFGQLVFIVQGAYETDSRKFSTWSYKLHGIRGAFRLGYGFDIGKVRLAPLGGATLGKVWQDFDSERQRSDWHTSVSGGFSAAIPLWNQFVLEATTGIGACRQRGASHQASYNWRFCGFIELGILAEVL